MLTIQWQWSIVIVDKNRKLLYAPSLVVASMGVETERVGALPSLQTLPYAMLHHPRSCIRMLLLEMLARSVQIEREERCRWWCQTPKMMLLRVHPAVLS